MKYFYEMYCQDINRQQVVDNSNIESSEQYSADKSMNDGKEC